MKCDEIVRPYLEGMRERFSVEAVEDGCIIRTPYQDPDNDPISIHLKRENNSFRISDQTQAMEFLFLHGIDIRPRSKQRWHFDSILRRLDVDTAANELYLEVQKEDLADGIARLIDAIKSAEHLVYTAKTRSQLDFGEQVAIWLSSNQIVSDRRKEFIGASGKQVSVDFIISRKKKVPAFMYSLHAESPGYANGLVNKTIVAWIELRDAGIQFDSVCLLDDTVEEDVWREPYPKLKRLTSTVAFWEERDELLEALA